MYGAHFVLVKLVKFICLVSLFAPLFSIYAVKIQYSVFCKCGPETQIEQYHVFRYQLNIYIKSFVMDGGTNRRGQRKQAVNKLSGHVGRG